MKRKFLSLVTRTCSTVPYPFIKAGNELLILQHFQIFCQLAALSNVLPNFVVSGIVFRKLSVIFILIHCRCAVPSGCRSLRTQLEAVFFLLSGQKELRRFACIKALLPQMCQCSRQTFVFISGKVGQIIHDEGVVERKLLLFSHTTGDFHGHALLSHDVFGNQRIGEGLDKGGKT